MSAVERDIGPSTDDPASSSGPAGAHGLEADVLVGDDEWNAVDDLEALVLAAADAAYDGPPATVSILLENDAAVRVLNATWRGKDKATNVLSFPSATPDIPGAPRHLGDIALAYGTLVREAETEGKPLAHHLQHLVVHGMLHLAGMDHMTADEADAMETRERTILAGLGVPDPYAAGDEGAK